MAPANFAFDRMDSAAAIIALMAVGNALPPR